MNARIPAILFGLFLSVTSAMASQIGGYLFVTFNGETTPLTEQIHFGLSSDGRSWEALNDSRPVLVSQIGEKGVRDPFILRSHDGKKFYIIATDLSIHLNPKWKRAATAGSKSIVVWESTDLVKWSKPRLVRIAADDAGCTWAPEAMYDEENGDYLVYWASANGRDNYSKFRIWAARTKDFVSFGEPFIYLERDYPVIDTTIISDSGRYYRFTKNERKRTIFLDTSSHLMGPWTEVPDFSLLNAEGYEGPTCYALQSADEGKTSWCLLLDHFTKAAGYKAFITHDVAAGKFEPADDFSFPFKFRHGSVLALSPEEYTRLHAARNPADTSANESSAANPLAWSNPLIPQRADPHVILHTDGYYYLTATAPEYDRIELRRARTLDGLSRAEPKVIWRKHEEGPMGKNIWAPELHFIDGKWYVYFSAGEPGGRWDVIRPYVLEGVGQNPLDAHWSEMGKMKLGRDSFSLDGTTFAHQGKRYFVWTQIENGVKGTNIYISRMDSPCSISGPITCISRPEHEWERRGHWVNEGPSVMIRNGRVWISYSASATDANYCLGLLSAPENADLLLAGSWMKSPEPVFKSDPVAGQFGPGHNCFTTSPDGKTDILVYHDRNYEKIQGDPLSNKDRATRAQVIHWKADGFPDFGTPVPDGPYRSR
jgi:GH43 family beta-xylosidase